MEIFFEYWKKGWKVWLMMLCINISYSLLFLPIIFFTMYISGEEGNRTYYFLTFIIGIAVAPALTYFVFRLFYREK